MKEDTNLIIRKMELSYQSVAKTVSDFGASIKDNNDNIIKLQVLLKDFIERTDKKIDQHEVSIDELKKSDTEIRSLFKGGRWILGGSIVIILGLVSTITSLWASTYTKDQNSLTTRIEKSELKYNEISNKILDILQSKQVDTKQINALKTVTNETLP